MEPLPLRQRDLLAYAAFCHKMGGRCPSQPELARHMGVNRSTVHEHIESLIQKGLLERVSRDTKQNIRLTPIGLETAWQPFDIR